MVARGLIVTALLVGASPARAQVACSATGSELVRTVMSAPAVALTPAQQVIFDRLTSAVRAGNRTAAQQELTALLRLRPSAAQPADACALVLRAVRLGRVDSDSRLVATLRAGPAGATPTTTTSTTYDRAVQTLAGLQQQMWEDALRILANLRA